MTELTPEQRRRAESEMVRAIEKEVWTRSERGMAYPQKREIVAIALTALLIIAVVQMKETKDG